MPRVVCENQRRLGTTPLGHLQRKVDTTERDGGKGLAIGVLKIKKNDNIEIFIAYGFRLVLSYTHFEDRVRNYYDGALEDMSEDENMNLLQRLIQGVAVKIIL